MAWPILMGVPGRLKAIKDIVVANLDATVSSRMPGTTTQRDRIDTTISSRAAAATALSNAVWLDAKAAYLDAAISGRMPGTTTHRDRIDAAITTRARVKSVQRGTILVVNTATTATATITAVTTGRSELRKLGSRCSSGAFIDGAITIDLTNSTTITATRNGTSNAAYVSWELTEYYPEGT